MSHTSPASYLVWAIVTVVLTIFLIYHLWAFDRFKCLRWNNGPYSGAFKRVMTYSYLVTLPLIMTYAIGFTIIKYHHGFAPVPTIGIIPMPSQKWEKLARDAIFPLQLMFAVGWSFEMVTHLEELCFWLFLVNAGSAQQDWFRSLYFKTWVVGSLIAVTYMPLVTIFTRSDPLKMEAYTFLAGSLGSLSLTVWFLPVLWTFPSFLASLRREGVDVATIVRLTTFHELNTIRVVFRFVMTVPLVILGADGIKTHTHPINQSMLGTDLLAIVAAFGCAISSGITLVIFFPRSIESEINAKDHRKRTRTGLTASNIQSHNSEYSVSIAESQMGEAPSGGYLLTGSSVNKRYSLPSHETYEAYTPNVHVTPASPFSGGSDNTKTWGERDDRATELPRLAPMRPNRRNIDDAVELGGIEAQSESGHSRSTGHNGGRVPNVNPVLFNFKSPIDLMQYSNEGSKNDSGSRVGGHDSRLTFNRR